MTKKPTTFLKRNRPDPLTKEESGRLWQRVASEVGFSDTITPATTSYATIRFQPAFAFVMGLLLIFTGSFTVQAANAAGPGDLLYPLDLALEDARLAVTPAGKREPLRLRYAMERIDELTDITETTTIEASTGDQEQLRSHQRYVEEYLNDVSSELSPGNQERVRQRFMEVTNTAEPMQQHQGEKPSSLETETEVNDAVPTEEPIRTQKRIQQETETYTPTITVTNTETQNKMQQTQPSEENTKQNGQISDDAEPKQTQEQTKNNTDQTDSDTRSRGSSSGGSGSGPDSSSGSGSGSGGKR